MTAYNSESCIISIYSPSLRLLHCNSRFIPRLYTLPLSVPLKSLVPPPRILMEIRKDVSCLTIFLISLLLSSLFLSVRDELKHPKTGRNMAGYSCREEVQLRTGQADQEGDLSNQFLFWKMGSSTALDDGIGGEGAEPWSSTGFIPETHDLPMPLKPFAGVPGICRGEPQRPRNLPGGGSDWSRAGSVQFLLPTKGIQLREPQWQPRLHRTLGAWHGSLAARAASRAMFRPSRTKEGQFRVGFRNHFARLLGAVVLQRIP